MEEVLKCLEGKGSICNSGGESLGFCFKVGGEGGLEVKEIGGIGFWKVLESRREESLFGV